MFASLGRLTCRDLVLNTRNHLASAFFSVKWSSDCGMCGGDW